jgi:murein DD-endopeptidase MepM/ murein hydrolase activator NlpD
MHHSTTAGPTRRLGIRLFLAVLAAAALLPLSPSGRAHAAVGGAGATDPAGVWPLQPQPAVVHGFAPPSDPWGTGHRGVDLAGAVGQTVHAALAGTVTFAGPLAGRGVVVVDHGPTRTTYEPVAASVSVGDVVAAGTPLGTLTAFQSHCLPAACLHWGWIRNADDVYLDPLRLTGLGAPVRLLPLWRPAPAARPMLSYPMLSYPTLSHRAWHLPAWDAVPPRPPGWLPL